MNDTYRSAILKPGNDGCRASCDVTEEACGLAEHQGHVARRVAVSELRRHCGGIRQERMW